MRTVKSGEKYKHFKGNEYEILTLAVHTETGEQMVIYRDLHSEEKVWARPLAMFLEEVEHDKYPDVKQKYRFELMESEEAI